jgi:6-phosphogluconolactonase
MQASQNTPSVVIEPTMEEAAGFAADLFKTILCESVSQRGLCSVALSGGTTPYTLYQTLARGGASDEVPWRNVEVFFGDERDVPFDNVENNHHMAQRTLLDNVPVDPSRIHPMRSDAEDLQAAAGEYEETIRKTLHGETGGVPRFDLILLGMGADGHTASLFPGTEPLQERKKLVTAYFVPVLGRKRITFTLPLINAAANVLMLVTGQDKAEAVSKLLGDNDGTRRSIPAGNVAPVDGKLTIVLDGPAASKRG